MELSVNLAAKSYKVKIHPRTGHKAPSEKVQVLLYALTLALEADVRSTPRLGCIIPGNDPVNIVHRLGGTQRRSGRVR